MDGLTHALLAAAMAGAAIVLGGVLARVEALLPGWLDMEVRHTVNAVVGGVLFAAVALVLAPHGAEVLNAPVAAACLGGGGILFLWVDKVLKDSGAKMAQVLAMLLDFVPEALALGAMLATGAPAALLLAMLIGLQNLPEGFNAYRDLTAGRHALRTATALAVLGGCALLGPLAAAAGYGLLVDRPESLGVIMLVASGGILYLTFQDIAPEVRLENAWAPPLGAVAGFTIGLVGHMLTT
ncbi:ZIP family metal transporter [Rhodospira trueperi]|uniref:Zinc transporter, ZIP family n=1 Tax=Rhodospira trueperi TaxID=69960 RepID=A0A1G7BH98_9PROT|nr:hypothetical protein [Rhodospira trueperi]SDE26267.1 zinc transporter, ZIP family [Rhodospira trueperi]